MAVMICRQTAAPSMSPFASGLSAQMAAWIVAPTAPVIAHNAGFDRKFAEKAFDVFATKTWACSMTQVPWTEERFEGAKLECLAMKSGFFYDGNRAAVDCFTAIDGIDYLEARAL